MHRPECAQALHEDELLHIFALIDEPRDFCSAASASRTMHTFAGGSCWFRRLNQHFGATVVLRGAQSDEDGLPAYVAFRKLWRAYYDGGWTPLRVDLDLLYQLTWHALRERRHGHDGRRHCASLAAQPTGAHWRKCSGWLLQAAACALDPLWLAHIAPGSEGIAAVCIGTALLDCQVQAPSISPLVTTARPFSLLPPLYYRYTYIYIYIFRYLDRHIYKYINM